MYAIAVIRYRKPFEEIAPFVDEHRAYLRELETQGLLVASGPLVPRTGGCILLRIPGDDAIAELDAIRDGDPYVKHGLAQYELLPWTPVMGLERLDRI